MKNLKSLLHIGADVDQQKKVLPEITRSILQILNTSAGDVVKCKALEVLSGTFEVKNVTVHSCTFNGGKE
jgi:hypothetical protein